MRRGWTPGRREQMGGIRTKVNSSQLSTRRRSGKLKTPLGCYTECLRLHFVSPLLQRCILNVHWPQFLPVSREEHLNALLHSTSLPAISISLSFACVQAFVLIYVCVFLHICMFHLCMYAYTHTHTCKYHFNIFYS